MELGAAWGLKKLAIPLIAPGVSFDKLPGPFKELNALRIGSQSDMRGLVRTVVKHTRLRRRRGSRARFRAQFGAIKKALRRHLPL
jgi:hypothetical protein